jgi:uncharacterized cupredoxin-like copper-binding protein
MKRMLIVLAGTAVLAAGVASAQAGRSPAPARSVHAATLITRVNVAMSEFKFVLSKKTVKRGVVIFKITNVGALSHDFMIKRRKTARIKHGKTATLRIVFLKKGHYQYLCTVPGHAAAGMKGVLTVT